MSDTTQTLIRSVLKIGSGMAIMHGYGEGNQWEQIISGAIAALSIVWGVYHRSHPQTKNQNIP